MLPTNRSKTVRRLAVVLAALVIAMTVLAGCGKDKSGAARSTEVIATYKDGKVTRGDYDSFVGSVKFFNPMYDQFDTDPMFQDYMIKQLIAFNVLSTRADEQSKKDGETRTKEQMEEINNYYEKEGKGKDGFDKDLKAANLTQNDIRSYILKSLTVLGDAEKKVTDDKVKAAYDEKNAANAYTIATVSHILVSLKDESRQKDIRTKEEALARAKEIKAELDAGGDFAALAKKYSDDPGSKENGGKYENEEIGVWVEGFKKAAVELPIGKVSDPVETEFGYHIMKVESRSSKPFEQVKAEIKSELAELQVVDFIDKELPGMIEKIDTDKLPKAAPEAGTGTGGGLTTTPAPAK